VGWGISLKILQDFCKFGPQPCNYLFKLYQTNKKCYGLTLKKKIIKTVTYYYGAHNNKHNIIIITMDANSPGPFPDILPSGCTVGGSQPPCIEL
jgi:hypothetical protein